MAPKQLPNDSNMVPRGSQNASKSSQNGSWADLGARSRLDFVEQCRQQWEQERTDLSPNSLVLSLDVCEATQEELPGLDCELLNSLYAGED